MRLLLGVIIEKVSVPVAGWCVSLKRKRSKVAGLPSSMESERCLAQGRMGCSVSPMRCGSDLWLRRLSTMPEWFSMAVDSQPEMAAKSSASLMRAFSM